jgi:hypothetical protein
MESVCIDPRFLELGTSWLVSRPDRFTLAKGARGIHWIEGWVGPGAGLDDMEKRKC